MAIANISAGAISTVTTTTVTPAFGVATTAGNLLVCIAGFNSSGAGVLSTSSTGWSQATVSASGTLGCGIFYKPNCGSGETAPTISCSGTTIAALYAELSEWSGVATASPVDQSLSGSGTTFSTPGADAAAGELVINLVVALNSKSATYTISPSWTPAGTVTSLNNTGATKALTAFMGSADVTGSLASFDQVSWTCTPSTGVLSSSQSSIVSFKLPAAAAATIPDVIMAPLR